MTAKRPFPRIFLFWETASCVRAKRRTNLAPYTAVPFFPCNWSKRSELGRKKKGRGREIFIPRYPARSLSLSFSVPPSPLFMGIAKPTLRLLVTKNDEEGNNFINFREGIFCPPHKKGRTTSGTSFEGKSLLCHWISLPSMMQEWNYGS